MKVVGIVAEYNPFHTGHAYQIDYAKNVLHADYVVVAMSGPFTQRGTIACFDKYVRAKAALLNGADIILEIPVIFSTASAKEFASAAVELLHSTGIVDTILFGAETDDKDKFINSASSIISLENSFEYQNRIAIALSEGKSYAQARIDASTSEIDTTIFESSNNILGFEYTKYIIENNLPITIECIKRQGNNYNDNSLQKEFSSASAIRAAINSQKNVNSFIPANVLPLYTADTFLHENSISQLLHYKLITSSDFTHILDCTNDISDRINKLKNEYTDFLSFIDHIASKNISRTRASRVLCHILLDITKKDFEVQKTSGYISYLRLLGFSQKGSEILSLIKKYGKHMLITTPTDTILKHDVLASDIRRTVLTSVTGKTYKTEYTKKFDLTNI